MAAAATRERGDRRAVSLNDNLDRLLSLFDTPFVHFCPEAARAFQQIDSHGDYAARFVCSCTRVFDRAERAEAHRAACGGAPSHGVIEAAHIRYTQNSIPLPL